MGCLQGNPLPFFINVKGGGCSACLHLRFTFAGSCDFKGNKLMKGVLSSTSGEKTHVIVEVFVLFACSLLGCSLPMQSSSFCKVIIIYFFSESLVFEISLPKFSLQNFWHRTVSAWSSYDKF